MIELHMTNGETVQFKGLLKEVMTAMDDNPVFLQVSPRTFVRTEDISIIQEVDSDEN